MNWGLPMSESQAPLIRHLVVTRFRGIEYLEWCPEPGANVILGGGDTGKSTILEAIALLLRPTGSTQLTDSDYWLCCLEEGFEVEGTFSLPDAVGINQLQKMVLPWAWDGHQACVPDLEDDEESSDPVYVLRVRGTADFEVFHEIVQPDGTTHHLPVTLRRKIGQVWLGGDDSSDRDLRLVYGSALDRLLSDAALRARLRHRFSGEEIGEDLKGEGKENLERLETAFRKNSLPQNLGLGLTGGRRISLNSLVGLTARKQDARLPVATWGTGTQRLAAVQVAAASQSGAPITLVDELERGLEPYRQRTLVAELIARKAQCFMTTHSPTVLSAAKSSSMWYLDATGQIGELPQDSVTHALRDPEAFLSRLTVVAEGSTEVGFVQNLLSRVVEPSLGTVGVWVTDAGGNAPSLSLLEGLTKAGLCVGAFVDNEGKSPQRWSQVKETLGSLAFQWKVGCAEENVIQSLADDRLDEFVRDPLGERTGERLRTLQERLQTEDKTWPTLLLASPDIRQTIADAATGQVPDWLDDDAEVKRFKKHSQHWFKSVPGGFELADKMFSLGAWTGLRQTLWPFVESVCAVIGLEPTDPEGDGV